MFSATFPKIARDLATAHLAHDHVRIRVGRAGSSHHSIKQEIIYVEPSMKRQALFDLLMSAPPARSIVFVNSKRTADEVDDFLFNREIPCTSIHSDRTQREREDSIRAFRTGKAPVLIATGVSARGLDIHHVAHVINYDLPSTQHGGIEEYTHRIGKLFPSTSPVKTNKSIRSYWPYWKHRCCLLILQRSRLRHRRDARQDFA
jgi:ATP-dependent RNA helicase DDX3X